MVQVKDKPVTNQDLFYGRSMKALENEKYEYVRYKRDSQELQHLKTMGDVKTFLVRHLNGPDKLSQMISQKSSQSHRLLLKAGFALHKRSKASREKRNQAKSEDEMYDYIRPGKFYLAYATKDNEPVYINGERVESDSEGELHRMLRYALDCKAQGLPNFLSENDVNGYQFSIKRDVFKVPKGEHTHIIEKKPQFTH